MSTIEDRVTQLFDLVATSEPDDAIRKGALIKRKVKVKNCSYDSNGDELNLMYKTRKGIIIGVRPEGSSDCINFKASYPPSHTGEKRLEELNRFINGIRGQEAYIVYTLNSRKHPVLQMIAPIETNGLYVKEDGKGNSLLVPYLRAP